MQSSKYPGWQIKKDGRDYLMSHPSAPMYAVCVMPSTKGGWIAEVLTKQKCRLTGGTSWEPCRNPYSGPVGKVCAEVLRRAAMIAEQTA